MASPTRWTRVWASSRSWWWTGKSGVLQFMGCRELDTTKQLDWTELTSLTQNINPSFSNLHTHHLHAFISHSKFILHQMISTCISGLSLKILSWKKPSFAFRCNQVLCSDSGTARCRAPSCTRHYLSICEKMSVPGFLTRIGAPLGRSWSQMSPQALSLVPFSAPGMWLLLSNCHLAHYFLGLDATHLNLQGTEVKQRRTGSEDSGKLQQKPVKHPIPLKRKIAARQNKTSTVH